MIIIMGSVGSGKSEQTTRLATRLNIPRLSTSQLLREHLTPEREAKMRAGGLINDKEILQLLEPELKRLATRGREFILDGSPRSVVQAEWLVDKLKTGQVTLTAIIKLKVSRQVVSDRLLKRGREDDRADVIERRLDAYDKITDPVIAYFRQNGIEVHDVDGEVAPEAVEAQIVKILDQKS